MRQRTRTLVLLGVCLTGSVAGVALAEKSPTLTWTDTSRDVYLDGELSRPTQVLSCRAPRRLALVSPALEKAIVIDVDGSKVLTAPKEAFVFNPARDRATTVDDLPLTEICRCTNVDGSTYLVAFAGRSILIAPHQGAKGEIDETTLWETVPVWKGLMEAYEPSAEAVDALKANEKETTLTVVLGTWCGDSKNYVPKLVKSLRAAGNAKLKTRFVGLAARFAEPAELVQEKRVTNVPTILVEQGGREIGRIVETPSGRSVEEDLAAILSGDPLPHPGHGRGEKRVATGTYVYRDASRKEVGRERWELFRTRDGGTLVHSEIAEGERLTDVWHEVDAKSAPAFLEVTKRTGDTLERARYWRDGKKLKASQKGNRCGILDQSVAVPDTITLAVPGAASASLLIADAPSAFVASSQLDRPLGAVRGLRSRRGADETVETPSGPRVASSVVREIGGEISEWWTADGVPVPVRGRRDGVEITLASLEIESR